MAILAPNSVYFLALNAIPKATKKFAVANGVEFARVLTAMAFQESCRDKNTKDAACFDTEARPRNKDGSLMSSAYGLTQILKDTQVEIERLMKWPKRPTQARAEPQYSMDLSAVYLAYFYNGGRKTPRGDWYAALVAYHDGHYEKRGAGHAYAKAIMKHLRRFDFDEIAQKAGQLGPVIAQLEFDNRGEFR